MRVRTRRFIKKGAYDDLSSAYRTNRCPRASSSLSSSSRRILASKGDRGPPWGAPITIASRVSLHPHTRPQILADQCQQPFIAHLTPHSGHQDSVVQGWPTHHATTRLTRTGSTRVHTGAFRCSTAVPPWVGFALLPGFQYTACQVDVSR